MFRIDTFITFQLNCNSDVHSFGPLKYHLGGHRFDMADKLQHGVLNWISDQATFFYIAGITAFPE
jgi:hypothetical protein